ncbi:MAG: LysO family transporter [Bacillota bacterium]|nr:LysO family transporter [Bacillota bacterium]
MDFLENFGLLALYFGMAFLGYLAGSRLRRKGKESSLSWTGKVQTVAIAVLVFMMGGRIGADRAVIESLGSLGLTAFLLTVFAFAGSVLAVMAVRKCFRIDREGVRRND